MALGLLRLTLLLAGCGCAGTLLGDGSSVSVGTSGRGALRHGAELAAVGDGYVIPPTWRRRGSFFGTDELIDALVRAARAVARDVPGGLLGVADLSPRGGGRTLKHRSHENGRDVDLIYFAVDDADQPLAPADAMLRYGPEGLSRPYVPDEPKAPQPTAGWLPTARRFDTARNWRLVRALLEDPEIEVQWIFIADHLRARLLEYAAQKGEAPDLIDRAAYLLHRPQDSQPHDDHMHVRVFCDPADRSFGCIDQGPVRWWKKHLKYMAPAFVRMDRSPIPEALRKLAIGPGWLLSAALH